MTKEMDPEKTLDEILALTIKLLQIQDLDAYSKMSRTELEGLVECGAGLAQRIKNLDEWLAVPPFGKAGFFPKRWQCDC